MEWRRIPNYPDYEISKGGTIRRVTPGVRWPVGHVLRPRRDGFVKLYRRPYNPEQVSVRALLEQVWPTE